MLMTQGDTLRYITKGMWVDYSNPIDDVSVCTKGNTSIVPKKEGEQKEPNYFRKSIFQWLFFVQI